MEILKKIRKWVYRLIFPLENIQEALDVKIAMSDDMVKAIRDWNRCWKGNAPWINEHVQSLRLEQSITREFANIALNEMTAKVDNEQLNDMLQELIEDLNIEFQAGLATGAMVIKPIGNKGVQFIPQSHFIPIKYDSKKRLCEVIFPELRKIGDKYYTHLEHHKLDKSGLTITNRAFVSDTEGVLGREIPIKSVDIWEDLNPFGSYKEMKKPVFGYYRNPFVNTIDGSCAGVSVFENALDMICKTDRQFDRIDWEFESGERAIHVDESALRLTENSMFELPHTHKRLYRAVNVESNNEDIFKEFSPALRQTDLVSGLDEYKREIEFQVGLSYGDLSNPQSVDKTATEIKAAKQRKYNTVSAIQKQLKACIEDTVYAFAFYNRLTQSKYELTIDFKDSILTDEETERKQDIQDLNLGIMRPEEYRAKWYGEDEKTALNNLPQSAQVIE